MMMPIIKINMGLVQCWMLFELSLHVQQSIRLQELEDAHFEADVALEAITLAI